MSEFTAADSAASAATPVPPPTPPPVVIGGRFTPSSAGDVTVAPPADSSIYHTPDEFAALPPATYPAPFGRYTLVRELGAGGMGTVYLAHDSRLDRPVALKVPRPEAVATPAALDRFFREARAAAQLDHSGICRVFDVGAHGPHPFISMAYVEGEPLSALVGTFADRPREAAELVRRVAEALAEAHARGVVHRDLKPANIMLDRRGLPVVMDFGLARSRSADDPGQTGPGVVMGTPLYMSPEQADGDTERVGPASDVYALGVVLYELLTGRTPFRGSTLDLLVAIAREVPAAPSVLNPAVDAALNHVCGLALSKRPEDRFPSAEALAEALGEYLAGRGVTDDDTPDTPERHALDGVLRDLREFGWRAGTAKALARLAADDRTPESARDALVSLLRGTDGAGAELVTLFPDSPQREALAAWAQLARPESAEATARVAEPVLEAEWAVREGDRLLAAGEWNDALDVFAGALEKAGATHPVAADVLIGLGRATAGRNHYHAAWEFLGQVTCCPNQCPDDFSRLRAAELVGRLHLDWDHPDRAEEYLNKGVRIAQRLRDPVSEARLVTLLGRAVMLRGDQAQASGKRASAQKRYRQAADYFEWATRVSDAHGAARAGAETRRLASLLAIAEGRLPDAEALLSRAGQLLDESSPPAERAKQAWASARLAHARGRHEDAGLLLREALAAFDKHRLGLYAARVQLDLARSLAASGVPTHMVVRAYSEALSRAEACRADALVRAIDQELEALDEETFWRHSYERVRSTAAGLARSGLHEGVGEVVSIVRLEMADFEAFAADMDPETVLQTLNQLMAEFEDAIRAGYGHITAYQGGGFQALFRESGHADRAVRAALELRDRVRAFNRLRGLLGLSRYTARIGVATGPAFLGNLGTYRYHGFAPIGPVAGLADSLAHTADPDTPRLCQDTHDQVRGRYRYRSETPERVLLSGIGSRAAWELEDAARSVRR